MVSQGTSASRFLVDHDDLENPLFELYFRISEYETCARFKHSANTRKSIQRFQYYRTLMDNTVSKAADLANELGSKSNVSNILNGAGTNG